MCFPLSPFALNVDLIFLLMSFAAHRRKKADYDGISLLLLFLFSCFIKKYYYKIEQFTDISFFLERKKLGESLAGGIDRNLCLTYNNNDI